ncbi:MAG TPA: hypothetical protein VK673_21805 [Chthoniobacterales bacterium]|nr:hypothetical protein [Chthoniobacterales bacterium]
MADGDSLSSQMWGDPGSGIGSQINVSPIGQPDAPKDSPIQNTAPPASQTPPDKTDEGQQLEERIGRNKTYIQELLRVQAVHNVEIERNQQMYQKALEDYNRTTQMAIDHPIPQPQLEYQQTLKSVNQIGASWLSTVGVLGFALAGMLGKRHSGIGSQMFVGSLLKSYAEGRTEAAKQQREAWHEQAEYEHTVNSERIEQYRMAIENERLNHQEKLSLVTELGRMNGDMKYVSAAEKGTIADVQRLINDDEKALTRYRKEMKETSKALDYMTGQKLTSSYEKWVRSKWMKDHAGKPPLNQDEVNQAERNHPISEFNKETKPQSSLDTEGSGPPDYSGKSTDEINQLVGTLNKGQHFVIDGVDYTKKYDGMTPPQQ